MLVDGPAQQIHAHAGPDGGDVIGAQYLNNRLQGGEHILPGDNDLMVVGAQIVRRLAGILQVDGVYVHADGVGPDGFGTRPGGNGAHQGGVQAAGEEKAHLGIGHQTLFHPGNKLLPNVSACGIQVVAANCIHLGHVPVAYEFSTLIVMPGRERHDSSHQTHQVFRLAGKENGALAVIAVVKRTDANGVTGGNKLVGLGIVEDAGKLCIQHLKHVHAILPVQREEDFAVGVALEGVGVCQSLFKFLKAVNFPVADHQTAVQCKRLHPRGRQSHNGQPVESQDSIAGLSHPTVIGTPGQCALKCRLKRGGVEYWAAAADNGAHE